MTSALPNVTATKPSDSELMVIRLFKVAEILSRKQEIVEASEIFVENRPEKHDDEEIGYRDTRDQLKGT